MKILAISDLHDRPIDQLLKLDDIDCVFVLGDITTGKGLIKTQEIMNKLRTSYPSVYSITGNWETADASDWLEREGISIDGKTVEIGGYQVLGIGGSTPTPFKTPREFPEYYYENMFKGWLEIPIEGRSIILSHAPPYGVCDKTFIGTHVGSKPLRNFILQRQSNLVLCGHIHEGRGKTNLDKTIVVNPGPAPDHYAILEIDKTISVELYSL